MYKISESEMQRVNLSVSCRDSDYIPKVGDAGAVHDDYQVMHNGVKIKRGCYHGDWMTKIIEDLQGHHEPQDEKAFYEVLKHVDSKNPTMIELGSNWSYYSMWFNKTFENATNIMVEPNRTKLTAGQENFKLNGMHGIFENAFVSDKSNPNSVFTDWDGQNYQLGSVCVDDLIQRYGLESVDILHADIQGAEYAMLFGCANAIMSGKIKCFFISTHGIATHHACLGFLISCGYKILSCHTEMESFADDGLIVASLDHSHDVIPLSRKM